jgi:predicted amidohydrolase
MPQYAAIQINSTPDIDANLVQAAGLIEQAAAADADLIVLPENFSFLGPEQEKLARVNEISERSRAFVREKAAATGAILLGGGFAVPSPEGKTYNRALLTGPDGDIAVYDKIHLFDVDLPDQPLRESVTVTPGREVVTAETDNLGVLGLSICYDLRFPELYRELVERGATSLLIPASFTAFTGAAHWRLLVRARAVENTCFVVAANQCGAHFGDRASYGHSLIVDPWGEVLAEAGSEPACVTATIDPARLTEIRQRIPSLSNRRL